MKRQKTHAWTRSECARLGTLLLAALALASCDSMLDVENPNELVEEDLLENPAAADALANGALATVARAVSEAIVAHDAASDELVFIGSRTAWLDLQQGELRDPTNEHVDRIWNFITEAHWMSNTAVETLQRYQAEGVLPSPVPLARAQLYSAIIDAYIADWWEDFPLGSDRREAAPPLGPENMIQLYERAIARLDQALPIAQAAGARELQTRILAQRARVKHGRAIWQMLNPPGTVPADPLVRDPGMIADAKAALALAPSSTWRWTLEFSSSTVSNQWGQWVNSRLDLRVSDAYVIPTPDGRRVQSVSIRDPIDQVVDPAAARLIDEAIGGFFQPITIVSAQELHLLVAEAALARGDMAEFTEHVNAVRIPQGLTPFAGQIDALALLKHMRRTNLIHQGRRLNDHYRFGEPSFMWLPSSEAITRTGTKLPITISEVNSNCHILRTC